MKLVKVKSRLPVDNFDLGTKQTTQKVKRHGNLLPNSIRCIIARRSNCGETNLVISVIKDVNDLSFKNVYLYSKSVSTEI